jgi:hypothetical protein
MTLESSMPRLFSNHWTSAKMARAQGRDSKGTWGLQLCTSKEHEYVLEKLTAQGMNNLG